jgi:hypothetical protein
MNFYLILKDFMSNPHRYFRDRNAPTLLEMKAPPKAIADSNFIYFN